MFFKNPLDKKFAQWARGKKVLPPNVSVMKEKFLSSVRLPAGDVKQARPPRFYFKILSVGLAVMVLFVGVNEYKKNSMVATQSPGWYGSDYGAVDLGMPSAATGLSQSENGFVRSAKEIAANVQDAIYDGMYDDNRAYPPVMQNTTIRDTREFSKINYNSNIKTRDVEDVSTRILTTIRGYGGRVDDASIAEEYASISFVVPKDNLVQFKTEIKSLVGKNFYVESLHIQNLLPQKVGLEDSTKTYNKLLSDAQEKLKDLNATMVDAD